MVTVSLGETFCKRYNMEMGTNHSVEDIFVNVLVPIVFGHIDRFLDLWTNTEYFQAYIAYIQKNKVPYDINESTKRFLSKVRDNGTNLETSLQVYGGCAEWKWATETGDTGISTAYSFSDNIHFTYEERICSWIGSLFGVKVEGLDVYVNDSDLIWDLFHSIKLYKELLDNNSSLIHGHQLATWNTIYLKRDGNKTDLYNINSIINDKKDKSGRVGIGNNETKLSLLEFLLILSKRNTNVKYLDIQSCGQKNESCGHILVDIPRFKRLYDVYEYIKDNSGETLTISDFEKIFVKSNIINIVRYCGIIKDNMYKPNLDIKGKNKEKEYKCVILYCKKMLENKDYLNFSETTNDFLVNLKPAKRSKSNTEKSLKNKVSSLFSSKTNKDFVENLTTLMGDCLLTEEDKINSQKIVRRLLEMDNSNDFQYYITYLRYLNAIR